ncbi:hypothetical protein T265_06196 [Opisthorchis viverrini]|uniref:SH2 domain protein n=1 Tax=Opisthorchis viverrini TaxID=6198 RepID=A0A074ZL87_OPIVI|nr:hypothetical protein T265_06196 [Opisthorchis viverrini]KER26552.1 hypothetical protein T265_06196 [Opisthorchis viverrini]
MVNYFYVYLSTPDYLDPLFRAKVAGFAGYYVLFLDFQGASDSVDRSVLFEMLAHQGMPRKFVNIMRSLYSQTSGRVRVYGELSKSFRTQSGVRQGCPLSPFLFNFVIDEIMRRTLEGLQNPGVQIASEENLVDLEYADDIVLMFEDKEKTQVFLDELTKVIPSSALMAAAGYYGVSLLTGVQVPKVGIACIKFILKGTAVGVAHATGSYVSSRFSGDTNHWGNHLVGGIAAGIVSGSHGKPDKNKLLTNAHSSGFMSDSDPVAGHSGDPDFKSSLAIDAEQPPPSLPPRVQRYGRSTQPHTILSPEASSKNSVASSTVYVERAGSSPHRIGTVSSPQPSRPHRFTRVSVSCPIICPLCNDYVITPRCSACQCTCCKSIFHAKCSRLVAVRGDRVPCLRQDSTLSQKSTESSSSTQSVVISDGRFLPGVAISTLEQPLINWNENQIAYWLSVVGLSRFVVLFLRNKINGKTLVQLAPYSSLLDQVTDPFARQALRRAIFASLILLICFCAVQDILVLKNVVLSGSQPSPGDDSTLSTEVDGTGKKLLLKPESQVPHHLRVTSFLQEVACASCTLPLLEREFTDRKVRGSNPSSASRPPLSRLGQSGSIPALVLPTGGMAARHLRSVTAERFRFSFKSCDPLTGLFRQGLQCQSCGMIFHRLCASLDDLPNCPQLLPSTESSEEIGDLPGLETLEYSHLPRRLPPYSSLYFGVALEDQVLDQYSDVPLFLLTCTNEIERIASDSFLISEERPLDPANLVHAYQQTALTSTLVELHRQFSHSLPSTGGSKSDVVRLTQLLKAFLRALPVSVIPEDHYRNFCGLSSVTSAAERTEAVHLFLAKLPHLHRVCLSHIMKHLDFVWFHQRKLQDYLATEPQELKNATSGSRFQHLCKPNSWLLVFRQILIRPPWPLLIDFAVGLEVHLRALQAVFFTLATTPSDIAPLGPAILNLPLPKKSLTEDSVESRCDADKFSRRNVVECFRFDNDSRLAWSKEEVGGIENVLASNDDPVLNLSYCAAMILPTILDGIWLLKVQLCSEGQRGHFILEDDPVYVVDKFVYLSSCVISGGQLGDEITLRIEKAMCAKFESTNSRLLFHLIVDADKLDYGTVEFSPLERLNTSQLSSPTIDTPPSPTSRAANARDLSTREWYWGDISPAGVREVMDGFSDGYFLVRDASANSVGAFTLAVRLHGENKLLRIYHRGDYFGVVDPPPPIFRLVSELIDYYRSHSIRVEEDILLRPISHRHYRFPRLAVSSTPTDPGSVCSVSESGDRGVFACNLSPNQLLVQLNRTNAELGQCESRIKELSDMAEQTMKSKDEASRSIKGYRKLQEWLQLQQQRLEQHSSLPSLERFHEVLHEKLLEAERQIKAGNQQFAVESNRCRDILKEQVHTTTRRRKLKRQAQEVHRALKHQGVPEDVILNHQNSNEETGGTLPTRSSRSSSLLTLFSREQDYGNLGLSIPKEITNSSAWFLPNVTREKAEQLLADKPSGTFLIRSSGDGSSLVLSVRVDSSVQHCLIHCDNGRYGFVRPPVQSFGSLEALVCHYHVYSLKQHNRLMTTTLRFPVNSNLL